MSDTERQIDVRELDPPKKHPTIFDAYDELDDGETFVIVNDHDPKPLKYQLAAQHANEKFIWSYLEEGPEVWKVRIGKIDS